MEVLAASPVHSNCTDGATSGFPGKREYAILNLCI